MNKFRETVSDILHERTNFNFVGRKRLWLAISGIALLIGLAGFGVRGLNRGIDFKGGTAWQVQMAKGSPHTASVRDKMDGAGVIDPKVVILGGDSVRVSGPRVEDKDKQLEIAKALAEYAHTKVTDVSITDVGPTWGKDVSHKAERALVVFFIAIGLYLTLRFEWKMALAALIAVVHDILITAGAYAVTQFEVTPATVIAFLTILGFSLYDTVVVFDKVKENADGLSAGGRETYSDVVNRSMNEVLMRSINTSFVAVLPVFSLLVVGSYAFGALTLKDFALALFIGLMTGAYSSIFVATPVLAVLKEREPRYQALRQRVTTRLATGGPAPAMAVPGGGTVTEAPEPAEVGATTVPRRPQPARRPQPPRGRQKRRRR